VLLLLGGVISFHYTSINTGAIVFVFMYFVDMVMIL